MHKAGHSKSELWENPEGWGREGGGRGFQNGGHVHLWLIYVDEWQNHCNGVK